MFLSLKLYNESFAFVKTFYLFTALIIHLIAPENVRSKGFYYPLLTNEETEARGIECPQQ